ncbi:MAG: hypothetical protein NZ608_07685 [candidate division WOR-3 bacterium]|nr:hypothetical protein [candidate division WOR-3 bacterium]
MIKNLENIPNWAVNINDFSYDDTIIRINKNWENVEEVAKAVTTFVFLWNWGAYGSLEPAFGILIRLEYWIEKNKSSLEEFRSQNIIRMEPNFLNNSRIDIIKEWYRELATEIFCSYESNHYVSAIKDIFGKMLKDPQKKRNHYVSAIKALHILCPHFFPLLDNRIAQKYHVNLKDPNSYVNFIIAIINALEKIDQNQLESFIFSYRMCTGIRRSFLKIFDEYNFNPQGMSMNSNNP